MSLPGETRAAGLRPGEVGPALNAATTLSRFGLGELDLAALIGELMAQADRASNDLPGLSADFLATQSVTLNPLFHDLARRASPAKTIEGFAEILKLAIRAQSAYRAPLEALALIQSLRCVAFVRAENAAFAHQQQTDIQSGDSARARELSITPSKLLTEEVRDGARVDTPVGGHTPLETLAVLDRAENAGGQGQGGAQPVQGRHTPRSTPPRASAPPGKANGRGEALDA